MMIMMMMIAECNVALLTFG